MIQLLYFELNCIEFKTDLNFFEDLNCFAFLFFFFFLVLVDGREEKRRVVELNEWMDDGCGD